MTTEMNGSGRARQRQRTRKDLLEAAARLLKDGTTPTLEQVAEEALVSRATAYRYFSNVEALLVEASLDLAFPDVEELFRAAPEDPVERMLLADASVQQMISANEPALRMMLVHSLRLSIAEGGQSPELRQNRRTPLIEAALAPARERFGRVARARLTGALALIIGTEAMLVFKDVLRLDDEKASEIRRWAIRALVEAAARDGSRISSTGKG